MESESDMQLVNIPTGFTDPPMRIRLQYLRKIPWRTTHVLTVNDFKTLFSPSHFIQPFLSSLLEQEALLMKSHTLPARMLRRLMDWEPRDLSGGDDPIDSTFENRLNFTCAYRIVDVLSLYDGVSRPTIAERILKNPKLPVLAKAMSMPTSSKNKWIDMSDMQTFLYEGAQALSGLEMAIPITTGRVQNPLHHLTEQLSAMRTHSNTIKVVRNILMASAMLLCISSTFKPMIVQGKPSIDSDNDGGWAQLVLDAVSRGGMSNNEAIQTKGHMKGISLSDMAKALRLSLMISPTILFSTRLLYNTRYDKQDLLEHSIELGNKKPACLADIEGMIWKMVLVIAKGEQDGIEAIKAFMRDRYRGCFFTLVESGIELMPIADRRWFLPAADVPMDDDIHDIEMEEPPSELEGADGQSSESKGEHDDVDEGDGKHSTIGQADEDEMESTVGEEKEEGSSRSEEVDEDEVLERDDKEVVDAHEMESIVGEEKEEGSSTTHEVDDEQDLEHDEIGEDDENEHEHEHEHKDEMDSTVDEEKDQRNSGSEDDDQEVLNHKDPEGVKIGLRQDESDAGSDSSSHKDDGDLVDIDMLPSPGEEQFSSDDVANAPEVPDHDQVGNDDYAPSQVEDEDDGSQLEVAAQMAKTDKNGTRTPLISQSNSAERTFVLRSMTQVDVDMLNEKPLVNLDINESPPKLDAPRELVGFDALGRKYLFTPRLHHNGIADIVVNLASLVEQGYVAGTPLHVANPDQSVLKIMTDAEYRSLSIDNIQNILRTQHILLTDLQKSEHRFDESGLRTLCSNLKEVFTVQDQSQPVMDDSCLKQGNLRQVLKCSRMKDGKILDALSFPMRDATIGNEPFASDLASWNNTFAEPICKHDASIPIQGIRWGHCATSGAFQGFHINNDGRGMFIEVLHGSKWCIFPSNLHGLNEFPDDDFDFQNAAEYTWELEAVMLVPGTKLIMGPNTPYAHFTESHSFCHGGYFYAMSTMKQTLLGIIHTLVAPTSIPNNTHQSALPMIRRMVIFVYKALVDQDLDEDDPDRDHVPNVKDFNSLIDLLSLVLLGLMSNALDFKTYRFPGKDLHDPLSPEELSLMAAYDLNAMDASERTLCMYVRGLAWELVDWVLKHYSIYDAVGQPVNPDWFFATYFGHIVYPILRSSSQPGVQQEKGAQGCTYERLMSQIDSVFPPKSLLSEIIQRKLKSTYPNDPRYTMQRDVSVVQHSVPVPPIHCLSSLDLIDRGRSEADERYTQGVRSNFKLPPRPEIDSDAHVDAASKKRKRE